MTKETDEERARRVMSAIDNTSAEIRSIIHEYGLAIVDHMAKHGITDPAALRQACARLRGERMKAKGIDE